MIKDWMRRPELEGVMERRLLVNFAVDPGWLEERLPSPFRPWLQRGRGVAGLCLIRFAALRPRGLPGCLGLRSENAAHRVAVEWDSAGGTHRGVYVPLRETDSRLTALAGGRLFPGRFRHRRFEVHETTDRWQIALRGPNDELSMAVTAERGRDRLPAGSIFRDKAEASEFFRRGCVGWSDAAPKQGSRGRFDGLELVCPEWEVEVVEARDCSAVLLDEPVDPACARLDHILLMERRAHSWRALSPLEPGR